ncbi:MAG: sigma 54-interacting transcriptional regulator [Blastocatellia bacterium]
MNPRLITIAGPGKGTVFALTGSGVSIGRDPENDLCLRDLSVSRKHCRILIEGTQFRLVDQGSRNGVFVNGQPVNDHPLRHGDNITLGDYQFFFLVDENEAVSASRPVDMGGGLNLKPATVLIRTEDEPSGELETPTARISPGKRVLRDYNTLLKIATAINATTSPEALQRQILDLVLEVIPAQSGAILLTDKSGAEITSTFGWSRDGEHARPVAVSHTVVGRALAEGRGLLANDVTADQALRDSASLLVSHVRAVMAVPMKIFRRTMGVLYLVTDDPLTRFDEDHLQLLTAISGIAAAALENAQRIEWLENENSRLRAEIDLQHDMVGAGPRMKSVYQFISKVAPTDSNVLIRGESGAGKELVARALHANSARAGRPFVAINCAALTETLLESELFGYEKGAFTGATAQKKGRIEMADGGTLFLDEMGELAMVLQAKLLRVLQEHEFERVGGTRSIKVSIRLIAATNRNLEQAIQDGEFRQDLFYRLNVVALTLPPLRERREDIPLLVNAFVRKYSEKCKRQINGIAPEAMARLLAYHWPGNIRELENAIERAVVLGSTDLLQTEDLPEAVLECAPADNSPVARYEETLRETKRQLVLGALKQAGGNHNEAARALGMHPNNLHRLIQNLGLRDELKK